jgi:hypothetical protein
MSADTASWIWRVSRWELFSGSKTRTAREQKQKSLFPPTASDGFWRFIRGDPLNPRDPRGPSARFISLRFWSLRSIHLAQILVPALDSSRSDFGPALDYLARISSMPLIETKSPLRQAAIVSKLINCLFEASLEASDRARSAAGAGVGTRCARFLARAPAAARQSSAQGAAARGANRSPDDRCAAPNSDSRVLSSES